MIYLDKIVQLIDGNFSNKLSAYPAAEYYGIATPVAVQRNSGMIVYPNVINIDGSVQGTFFQHNAPYISYHRLLSTTFRPNASQRFGQDAMTVLISSTIVQLVVMGMRNKINVSPESLIMQLVDTLPAAIEGDNLNALGIQSVGTKENSIEYDSRAIFNREFQGIKYFIGPEAFLVAARYTIEGTYLKGCASNCNC